MTYEKPLPIIENEPYAKPFWEALQDERLVVQGCTTCDRLQYFPRPWCKHCGADELIWQQCSGEGTIASYTIIHNASKSPEFADAIPYCYALVELAEGVTMPSNIVGAEMDRIDVGLAVEIEFEHVTDEVTLPKFRPRD